MAAITRPLGPEPPADWFAPVLTDRERDRLRPIQDRVTALQLAGLHWDDLALAQPPGLRFVRWLVQHGRLSE